MKILLCALVLITTQVWARPLLAQRDIENAITEFEVSMKHEVPSPLALIIQLEELNPRVNADIIKNDHNEVVISVMGGMLHHPKMNHEALKLLLCHEMGHLLGGPPYKSRGGWSSTEGQADFYSGLSCARYLGFDERSFVESAITLTTIYAEVTREPLPRLNSCEERPASRTNYGYPSVQCRLDTLMAGWEGLQRPNCWFRE